jgi:hypothetical protein
MCHTPLVGIRDLRAMKKASKLKEPYFTPYFQNKKC